MTNLWEKADKDSKARAAEVVKMGNEMDRMKMAHESLAQVKLKLEAELDALKKRFADLDRDNRKVTHEREELDRAYKKSEEDKTKALHQVSVLEKELAKLKADFDKKFGTITAEYEANKKELVDEINILTRKLHDCEAKLKNEVEVIKKKMSITITELEMSLDGSNKSNVQLQNTCKVQGEKIMQLTAAYDDVNKKLGASVQQYDITIKKLTAIEAEFKSLTVTYNNTLKIVKDYEGKMGGLNKQVADLTQANTQLGQVKVKLEKDLSQVSKDYDDIARELKLADDRANKAGSDAHHFESLLRE